MNDEPTHVPLGDEPIDDISWDDDESPVCPECGNDDCNLKWYLFDDDTDQVVGKLLECESCGTKFTYWLSIPF